MNESKGNNVQTVDHAVSRCIIDLCQDELTKNNPAMVAAIAELYKAFLSGFSN